jgi:hypothetical protein
MNVRYNFHPLLILLVGDYTEDPNFDLQDYLRFREQCPDPRADDE